MRINIVVSSYAKQNAWGWAAQLKAFKDYNNKEKFHKKFIFRISDNENCNQQRVELISYIMTLQCIKPSQRSGNKIHLYCSQYVQNMITKDTDGMWAFNAKSNPDLIIKLREMINKYDIIHMEDTKAARREYGSLSNFVVRKVNYRQWRYDHQADASLAAMEPPQVPEHAGVEFNPNDIVIPE